MAKFCTKCGRPLQDGEICTCQSQTNTQSAASSQANFQQGNFQQGNFQQGNFQQDNFQQGNFQQGNFQQGNFQQGNFQQGNFQQGNSFNFSTFLNESVTTVLNILKAPVLNGVDYIKKGDFKLPLVLVILQALMSALFAIFTVSKISDSILGSIKGLSSLVSLSGYEFPLGLTFILTLLVSAACSFILAGLLLAAYKICKTPITFFQVLSQVSLRSIFCIILTLLAFILGLINPMLGAIIFYLGNLAGFLIICLTASYFTNNNIFFYILFAMILIYIIVTSIITSIASAAITGSAVAGAAKSTSSLYKGLYY